MILDSKKSTVFIFGNPDLAVDFLPLRILPKLRKKFPAVDFKVVDPNEEMPTVGEEVIIIDTVLGIEKPQIFDDLSIFEKSPRVSLHDFDALANLLYLKKLGRLKKINIIGLPASPSGGAPMMSEKEAVKFVSDNL